MADHRTPARVPPQPTPAAIDRQNLSVTFHGRDQTFHAVNGVDIARRMSSRFLVMYAGIIVERDDRAGVPAPPPGFRLAPAMSREQYPLLLAALVLAAGVLACDPLVSAGAPQPQMHLVPGPGHLLAWTVRALLFVTSTAAYGATLGIMR